MPEATHLSSASIVTAIQAHLDQPYPATVSRSLEGSARKAYLLNHLRNRPNRKVIVVEHFGGDYDYDAHLTNKDEFSGETKVNEAFELAKSGIVQKYGAGTSAQPEDLWLGSDFSEPEKIETFDGEAWTPSYEGGATFENADSDVTHYWMVGDQWLCLQRFKWQGDGEFDYATVITITPQKPRR